MEKYSSNIELAKVEKIEINEPNKLKRTVRTKYAGIMFALLAAATNSFGSLFGKMLTKDTYHPLTIAFWRYQALTTLVPLIIMYMRVVKKQNVFEDLRPDVRRTIILLLVRGTVGLGASGTFMYALKYLSVADTTVITFSTPIAVTLFAKIFLREPCGVVPIIIALVTLSGVVVMSRPPLITGEKSFDVENLIGIALAFASMLTVAFLFVLIRYLRKLHFTLFTLTSGYVASTESGIICLLLGVLEPPQNLQDFCVAAGFAMSAFLVQIFTVLSLRYEQAGPVSLVRTSDILFAFITQFIFLGVQPNMYSIIGALIIVFGVFSTTFRKWLSDLPEDHPTRIKYWCILK